jgi:hypothetical protein
MASLAVVVVTALATLLVAGVEAAARFDDVVQPSWANDHMVYDGDLLKLRLDPNSGSSHLLALVHRLVLPACADCVSSVRRRRLRVQEQVPVWEGERRSEAGAGGLRWSGHRSLCELVL